MVEHLPLPVEYIYLEVSVNKRIWLVLGKALLSLGVPVVVCIIAILVPLQSLAQQGMLGIIFLWLELELIFGQRFERISGPQTIPAISGVPQPVRTKLAGFSTSVFSMATMLVLTAIMAYFGRNIQGESVIAALIYLVSIGFCTFRWGRLAGASASVTAAITFDFFFIPPLYTFNIGSLEGWLILAIFLLVAIIIVGNMQMLIISGKESERRATFLYEFVTALANLGSREDVANLIACYIQEWYMVNQVQVKITETKLVPSIVVDLPASKSNRIPDLTLPLYSAYGVLGEIALWKGPVPLPPADDHLIQSLLFHTTLALIRVQVIEERNALSNRSGGQNSMAEI